MSRNFAAMYGDGSLVVGPVYRDTLAIAGRTAKQAWFSPINTMGASFDGSPVDGIVGLGFEALSNIGEAPFVQTLFEQGAIPRNAFSFALGDGDKGELYLGGQDRRYYSGRIATTGVVHQGCKVSFSSPSFFPASFLLSSQTGWSRVMPSSMAISPPSGPTWSSSESSLKTVDGVSSSLLRPSCSAAPARRSS